MLFNKYRRAVKEARLLLREARRMLRRYSHRLSTASADAVRDAIDKLAQVVDMRDYERLADGLNGLDRALDDHLSFARKSTLREYGESIGVAILIALFLRAFVVEAFKIPSGSMIPTLQVGDHIFVNKFIYGVRIPWTNIKFGMGYRKPRRGEVIVFIYPEDRDKDFIKRIVAVEGDTVEIRDNQIFVNARPVPRKKLDIKCHYDDYSEDSDRWEKKGCEAWQETVEGNTYTTIYDPNGGLKSWAPRTVPKNSVFVMGDNRDNSHDSRFWGYVPFELIKGKAMVIWLSLGEVDDEDSIFTRFFKRVRWEREGHLVR
jgi:signal peptidase I